MKVEVVQNLISNSKEFDFHIHSNFSFDSILPAKKIIKTAAIRGLQGVAITDHNTIKGGLEARKVVKELKSNLQVIIGEEVRTEFGDLIGLFLTEEIKSKKFDEMVDEIKEQDGFVILPHPFKSMNLIPMDVLNKLDAIEVLNGRTHPLLNKKAQYIADKHNIPCIGGSDAHLNNEIGRIRTIFPKGVDEIDNSTILRKTLRQSKCSVFGKESSKFYCYISLGIKILKKKHIWGGV
ncbi:MAG: PHP domain-containing protein [Candidatus Methanoperedens sp.]|nr:PHP domain-containing protein [Candidatus Methanoperedens sp.]